MLKRISCLGVVVLLTMSLSLSALAASRSTVSLGFPFFSNLWLRQGSGGTFTTLYDGSNGSSPISGVSVTPSAVQTSGSSYNISLRMGGSFSKTVSGRSFSYTIPKYTSIEQDGTDTISGNFHGGTYSGYYDPTNYQLVFADPTNPSINLSFSGVNFDISSTTQTYSLEQNNEQITISNSEIVGGDYLITGYFQYPANTLDDLSDLFTGSASCYIWVGSQQTGTIVDISDLRFSMDNSSGQTVSFSAVINVPATFQNVSRVNLIIYTQSGVSAPLSRFGVSTGGFEYNDTVTGIGGLSSELSGWFSGLRSGLGSISSLLRNRDQDAEQAADNAVSSEVASATSDIISIHTFEGQLNDNIVQGVQQIDFSMPTGTGFVSALAFIYYCFGVVFNALGLYQYLIMIPLILGLMLLLIGRSHETVGPLYNAINKGDWRGP